MAELVDVFLTVDGLLSILADVPWSGSQVCLSVDHRITGPVDHVISWHGVVTDGRSVWFLADRTGGRACVSVASVVVCMYGMYCG